MKPPFGQSLNRLVIATHRDVGYLLSALVIAYCLSGLALNHADLWNPDFVVTKRHIAIPARASSADLTAPEVEALGQLVGEPRYRVFDTPTPKHVKVYYENATLLADFAAGTALYERVSRRPVFYQANVLHKNSYKPWRWLSDLFAVLLILLSLTGLFIRGGVNGLGGRGKWFILAGSLPAAIVLILFR
ncbi:MAG: PepSY-associated TM helix domain-containing protein [Candidatus Eisenbacteria bacterium]|nr:PepSY-associated TM helix domain-containing protein [Candidatus Eisenbacteria bacterium]